VERVRMPRGWRSLGWRGVILLLLLAQLPTACQSASFVARSAGQVVAAPHAAAVRETIWGRASTCPCKGDVLGKIASAIEDARIAATFESGPSNPEYRYFSVSFDPGSVPRARIVEIVEANGGSIVEGPPLNGSGR
jgi:hypothetical protein